MIYNEDKICKHLDGDLIYCLMIKSKCRGSGYCNDYEEETAEILEEAGYKKKMRRIYFSKYGIHFETNAGQINAHWKDLFGIGLADDISNHTLKSMKRFWGQVLRGIVFLIRGKF